MLYPFILTTLAGMATMIGTIPIFVKIKNSDRLIAAACAFASGVMISVSVFDLIPEAINYFRGMYKGIIIILITFIFIILGMYTSLVMDKLVNKVSDGNNLFKVGILSMIVIILHNIPEGIVTYIVSNKNIMLGVSICIAIALHNIPEGISIAIPLYYSTGSKLRAFLYTLVSSLSELLGAIITYLFLGRYINEFELGILFSFIAGIMIQISYSRLLPTSKNYDNKFSRLFFMIGFIFMLFSLFLNSIL